MIRLNSYQGKRLLALARGADYAHAGETEAIDMVWSGLPKSRTQKILDAGCGRGGTAAYMYHAGWGRVTGIDIEGESIVRAREAYPEISFEICSVEQSDRVGKETFDIVCCFNSFYAFPDQAAALFAFARAAKSGAGWSLEVIRDVSTDYERWYRNFSARIHDLQPMLVQECGIEIWEYAVKFYDTMYETVQNGDMGGAIVYAVKPG
jgi:SAM-dependent methyltransferase